MSSLYKIIPFNVKHGNCGGSLVQFQQGDDAGNALPFPIGKVLVMSDIQLDDIRGNHAHYETEEILVALTGGCVVDLDDGCGRSEQVRLTASAENGGRRTEDQSSVFSLQSSDKEALLLYPHVWRVMRDFEPGTTLMVVANMKYDESDYIRDRSEFEEVSKHWNDLGGSAAAEEA
ncbi:MAG: FdtA/QdtA family cupin domain-containing protein [Verrucomicrobia bacterium]|nr:FdtA/QdtA family cupin domain-containing protein [Verrucomicrobiota bacterium]